MIVRNVLYIAQTLLQEGSTLDNWNVVVTEKGYVVNMYIHKDSEFYITSRDLQAISDVNPSRVMAVGVAKVGSAAVSLRVSISNKDQPIVVEETDVVRVRKRRRFWFM